MSKRKLLAITLSAVLTVGIFSKDIYAWEEYEDRLIEILSDIQDGRTERALEATKELIGHQPSSRLGNLIYADLMAARGGVLPSVGGGVLDSAQRQESLPGLIHELTTRWRRHKQNADQVNNKVPSSLLKISSKSRNVVYADLSESRLYVYENYQGKLKLVKDFFVTQGLQGSRKRKEGDQRTPVGVYYTTGFIAGATLPSRYGPGALPINYPNPIDRQHQRTGYGIWIHGTEPFLLNRAPQASDGCLSLNNDDFLKLNDVLHGYRHVPVIIDDNPNWVAQDFLAKRSAEIVDTIQKWRQAWESRNPEALFAYYDNERFSSAAENFDSWSRKKELALQIHENLNITIQDLEIFEYPGEEGVVLADFQQKLESDHFTSTIRKQQYWKQSKKGDWKVIYEGLSQKSPPPKSTLAKSSGSTTPPSS
ncbi:MAG: murein L,D-transpeptidase YafK [Gammaproteobacteria bacterium]|jgi:murein L,D-transpeptidase YafK